MIHSIIRSSLIYLLRIEHLPILSKQFMWRLAVTYHGLSLYGINPATPHVWMPFGIRRHMVEPYFIHEQYVQQVALKSLDFQLFLCYIWPIHYIWVIHTIYIIDSSNGTFSNCRLRQETWIWIQWLLQNMCEAGRRGKHRTSTHFLFHFKQMSEICLKISEDLVI